ncbi:hypothetical protein EVAR_776_1 [Eumeta japonica]|uniref:Uncharacterized protein n=1 Tax=Eumeta variegata TaxID=151549 RepID=A0A4C1SES4_EUMVA|nr:hypothetical protein EVAR_776_1 [Eumeta japonica]
MHAIGEEQPARAAARRAITRAGGIKTSGARRRRPSGGATRGNENKTRPMKPRAASRARVMYGVPGGQAAMYRAGDGHAASLCTRRPRVRRGAALTPPLTPDRRLPPSASGTGYLFVNGEGRGADGSPRPKDCTNLMYRYLKRYTESLYFFNYMTESKKRILCVHRNFEIAMACCGTKKNTHKSSARRCGWWWRARKFKLQYERTVAGGATGGARQRTEP